MFIGQKSTLIITCNSNMCFAATPTRTRARTRARARARAPS